MGRLRGPSGSAWLAIAEAEGEGRLSMMVPAGAGHMLAPWLLAASDAVNQASSPLVALLAARFLCSLRTALPSTALFLDPCQLVALSPLIWPSHLFQDKPHYLTISHYTGPSQCLASEPATSSKGESTCRCLQHRAQQGSACLQPERLPPTYSQLPNSSCLMQLVCRGQSTQPAGHA